MHHMFVQLVMDSTRVDHSLGVRKRPIAVRTNDIVRASHYLRVSCSDLICDVTAGLARVWGF